MTMNNTTLFSFHGSAAFTAGASVCGLWWQGSFHAVMIHA